MSSELRYPRIMQPGQLRELNDYVISKIGVPVFFATPEPSRPHSEDPCSHLYEIITGLYIIYFDYGIRLLSQYIKFTKRNLQVRYEDPHLNLEHYYSISALRGGFCHGSLSECYYGRELMQQMVPYFDEARDQPWPGMLPQMTAQDCTKMVNILSEQSDKLYSYIKRCADVIADNPHLLTSCKRWILSEALDKQKPQRFNGRIVADIENIYGANQEKHVVWCCIGEWLSEVENKILDGTISGSDYLQDSLMRSIERLYHPTSFDGGPCSADILF